MSEVSENFLTYRRNPNVLIDFQRKVELLKVLKISDLTRILLIFFEQKLSLHLTGCTLLVPLRINTPLCSTKQLFSVTCGPTKAKKKNKCHIILWATAPRTGAALLAEGRSKQHPVRARVFFLFLGKIKHLTLVL